MQGRATQRPDPVFFGLFRDLHGVAAFEDDPADGFGHRHDLVDADAALVAIVALLAADRAEDAQATANILFAEAFQQQGVVGNIPQFLALFAEAAGQALGDDQVHRGGDGIRLDAHVDHARQGARRIVGVQGGEHQMPRLGGLDGRLGSLQIADFADHDHVRILAQEGFQGRSEGQPHLGIDVHLVDAGHVDFDRVFAGRDVAVFGVQDIDAGIERHGLAAAGRTRDEDHAVGFGQRIQIKLALEVFVTEHLDAELRRGRVEDTQHDLLAKQRRAGVDAKIDGAVFRQPQLDAPVLRHATFGDIQPRHDLETRRDLVGQCERRRSHLLQHAVEAGTHPVVLLVGLEMDVRGAALDRIEHDLVDEAHHRGVFDVVTRHIVGDHVVVAADLQAFEVEVVLVKARHRGVDGFKRLADHRIELVLFDDDRVDADAGLELDLVDGGMAGGVGNSQKESFATQQQRQDAVLGQQALVDRLDRFHIEVDGIEVEQRYAEFRRGGDCDLGGINQLPVDEVGDQADMLGFRPLDGMNYRVFRDQAVLDQSSGEAAERRIGGGYGHRLPWVTGKISG